MNIITSINAIHLLTLFPKVVKVMFLTYLGLKFLDFGTGLLKVGKNGGYKSSKMREGIIKFTAELMAFVFVVILDMAMALQFYLTGLTLALFVYKECGSILENLGELGVYLPPQLKSKIEILNPEKEDKGNEGN